MEGKHKYVMATIKMPIEIQDLEEDDYVCLQDRARVTLAFCEQLPDIAAEGEGYGGLSDKIHDLFITSDQPVSVVEVNAGSKNTDTDTDTEREKGGTNVIVPEKRANKKRNITYRSFHENTKSHRYTSKIWH